MSNKIELPANMRNGAGVRRERPAFLFSDAAPTVEEMCSLDQGLPTETPPPPADEQEPIAPVSALSVDSTQSVDQYVKPSQAEGEYKRQCIVKDSATLTGRSEKADPVNSVASPTFVKSVNSATKKGVSKNGALLTAPRTKKRGRPSNADYVPPMRRLVTWHIIEAARLMHLGGSAERKAFDLARECAENAVREGKPTFPFALALIMKRLGVSKARAGKLREALVQKEIISEISAPSKVFSRAGIYRWNLRTTLQLPPHEEEQVF